MVDSVRFRDLVVRLGYRWISVKSGSVMALWISCDLLLCM